MKKLYGMRRILSRVVKKNISCIISRLMVSKKIHSHYCPKYDTNRMVPVITETDNGATTKQGRKNK